MSNLAPKIALVLVSLCLAACGGRSGSSSALPIPTATRTNPMPPAIGFENREILERDESEQFADDEYGVWDEEPEQSESSGDDDSGNGNGGSSGTGGGSGSGGGEPVPEPGTLILVGAGLAIAGWSRRRSVRAGGAADAEHSVDLGDDLPAV